MPDGLEAVLSLQAMLADMARLSDWVDEVGTAFALVPSRLFALRLCTEELVTNVIMHSRPASEATTVAIKIRLVSEADILCLIVADDGVAFDPTAVAEPVLQRSLEDVQVGGLGLVLVRKFAAELKYERVAGTNRVEVVLDRHG